ncbi:hypothetical protein IVW58_07445 [Salmonella enterica subsp. enterica serovar Worthington]|nr:hypothetical protein [Salmonella enterica subsp. enterica serovar Worthington]MBP1522661.1 hypothetical protein [Salmonella enterica subsp. enterica serovar Worthington]
MIAEEQQSSEPLEKIEDPANEKEPSAKGNSDYSQVAIVNKCDERSDSVPVAVSGTDVAEGEQFLTGSGRDSIGEILVLMVKQTKSMLLPAMSFYPSPVSFRLP